MYNEDKHYHQLEDQYYEKLNTYKPIEVPTECNYDEPLEDGRCYWQVKHGWNEPTYIGDDLDDINGYMEQEYDDGGGYDTYIDAVTALTDEEGTSVKYVIYTNGEVKNYGYVAKQN